MVLALYPPAGVIAGLALLGVLSTDTVGNRPATTLEQVMLTAERDEVVGRAGARVYEIYNAVASLAGAAGALARWPPEPPSGRSSWPVVVLVPLGVAATWLGSR